MSTSALSSVKTDGGFEVDLSSLLAEKGEASLTVRVEYHEEPDRAHDQTVTTERPCVLFDGVQHFCKFTLADEGLTWKYALEGDELVNKYHGPVTAPAAPATDAPTPEAEAPAQGDDANGGEADGQDAPPADVNDRVTADEGVDKVGDGTGDDPTKSE